MTWQKLASRYHDFSALMDRGRLAIEAEDLEVLEAVARESARLLADMHETWAEAVEAAGQDPTVSAAELESLRAVMQEALHRSQDNQDRIAAWQEETGGTLRTVAQGARATAGYARSAAGGAAKLMTHTV